ncbi:MAG: HIT family protein [Methanotrichaceae archaeon]|nr:HIT family protein [Methanotrichaceae archaeon]
MSENNSSGCIFCQIVQGRANSYKITEDEKSLAILDINPLAKGHCLVIPKRHVPWWHDLTQDESESLFKISRIVSQRIMKAFNPDFVCMYARGRRIPHTHIFLVPTQKGDPLDRFFNALEGFQEAPRSLVCLSDRELMQETANILKDTDNEI